MDVETFIEVVERTKPVVRRKRRAANSSTVTHSGQTGRVLSCVKDLTNGRVSCKFRTQATRRNEHPAHALRDDARTYPFPELQQPAHPVEMETVVLPNGA